MNTYQIFLAIIATLFLVSGFSKFLHRERSQTVFKFLITCCVWGGILIISIFPNVSYKLSLFFGLGQNLNTLIFIGFVTVFIVLFKLLSIIERLEQNISEMVRKEALKKLNE
jgi:hypothetical protein